MAQTSGIFEVPGGKDLPPPDADAIAEIIAAIFGSDWASAGAFVSWCEAQTRALVLAEAGRIEKLASALLEYGTVSGADAAAILGAT